MRKIISLFCIFFITCCFGQYGQRLHHIFIDGPSNKGLPKDFQVLKDSLSKMSGDMFFRNLQRSGGTGAVYTSIDLLYKKDFNFLNTDFVISGSYDDIVYGVQLTEAPLNALDTWKGMNVVDFEDFDPLNNTKMFFYYKYFLNLTDTQLLAHFLNSLDYNSEKSPLMRFITDVSKVNKIKIGEGIDDKTDNVLKKVCEQINKQMPDSDCGFAAYKTYIVEKDDEKTRKNIDKFYRNLSTMDVQKLTDDFLLPRGKIEFITQKVKLKLPNKFFYKEKKNDNSDVSFFVNRIEHHLVYDFEKKTYILKLKMIPYQQSISSDFKFMGKYHDVLKGKDVVENIPVERNKLRSIELYIYPNFFEAYVTTENGFNDMMYKLNYDFVYNKQTKKK